MGDRRSEPTRPQPTRWDAAGSGPPAPAPGARLEALFRDYGAKVYRLALRCGLDPDEAEDGVQEVFLKVQRRMDTFRGEAALSTWLYQVALHTLLDQRRRTLRHRRPLPLEPAEDGRGDLPVPAAEERPDEALVRSERRRLVREAMDRLPRYFREVLILRELEGMSYRDMARILALAQGTVESRLFRARERLAAELRRLEEIL